MFLRGFIRSNFCCFVFEKLLLSFSGKFRKNLKREFWEKERVVRFLLSLSHRMSTSHNVVLQAGSKTGKPTNCYNGKNIKIHFFSNWLWGFHFFSRRQIEKKTWCLFRVLLLFSKLNWAKKGVVRFRFFFLFRSNKHTDLFTVLCNQIIYHFFLFPQNNLFCFTLSSFLS